MTPFDILVAYLAPNRGIGASGRIPWHVSIDLRRFRQRTMGHVLILGRVTWESLPKRRLPGRFHIVITRRPHVYWNEDWPDTAFVASLDHALEYADHLTQRPGMAWFRARSYVIGGESVYRDALHHPLCNRVFVTELVPVGDAIPITDRRFPYLPRSFRTLSKTPWTMDGTHWVRFLESIQIGPSYTAPSGSPE